MTENKYFIQEESLVKIGKRIRTDVEFSGVAKGTEGIVSEADASGTVAIVWDMPERQKPLMDWFSKTEYEKYLTEIESKPWTGPVWPYPGYYIRPSQTGGYEGCRRNNRSEEIIFHEARLTDAIDKIFSNIEHHTQNQTFN